MNSLPPIYFYLPEKDWLDDMPNIPDVYWEEFGRGIYCWTLQTYLYLKADGFPCKLVKNIPDEGIIIAHRDSFPYELRPKEKQLLICIKPDRNPHPYAQLHIVQNPQDAKVLKNSYYIPLWRQPGLISRKLERHNLLENIAYFGINSNLAPELKDPSWSRKLAELGLNWIIMPRNRWYDYSEVDAIIAVRSFDQQSYIDKPATKLYNSWHAGVIPLLGQESAFQSEQKTDLDYFEISSVDEAIAILKQLKDNPKLCQQVRKNGQKRASETSPGNIVKQWRYFLTNIVILKYIDWCNTSRGQKQFYLQSCYLKIKLNALLDKFKELFY
ncbi:hypothetical protein Cyast_1978 [Cyanobacterium stanieri PCC 7202]|uniref:Glycosyltransferase family 1 protein n=1 Tax=Cyanobacterium stanieri (strain ATCC 29140 / PCC 7202) TaxID=292563 RepID=K9YLX6_CYASC|nr:hypothetical protein Cyast_1978 [Cyanobacterium stanieri PCC 7202]